MSFHLKFQSCLSYIPPSEQGSCGSTSITAQFAHQKFTTSCLPGVTRFRNFTSGSFENIARQDGKIMVTFLATKEAVKLVFPQYHGAEEFPADKPCNAHKSLLCTNVCKFYQVCNETRITKPDGKRNHNTWTDLSIQVVSVCQKMTEHKNSNL